MTCPRCLGSDTHPKFYRHVGDLSRPVDLDFARHDAYARLDRAASIAEAEEEAQEILSLDRAYRLLRGWSDQEYPSETLQALIKRASDRFTTEEALP